MNDVDMRIMSVGEFVSKWKDKGDKKFRKGVSRGTRIFCDFKVFSNSKIVKKLIGEGIVVFPIDVKKVPFSLQ